MFERNRFFKPSIAQKGIRVPVQSFVCNWLIPTKIFKPKKADISARSVENCWSPCFFASVHKYCCAKDNVKKIITKKGRKNLWGKHLFLNLWQGLELVLKASTFTWQKLYFHSTRHSKLSPFWLAFAFTLYFTDVYVGFISDPFSKNPRKSSSSSSKYPAKFLQRIFNLCHHLPSFWKLHFPR